MYWPSSGKTAGYEKGKYSHALPAGVACIGIFSLAIGVIISVGFPNIVLDWTKNYACIMGPWQNEYSSWLDESKRNVTLTVRFWNLTNVEDFLHKRSYPNFTLTESITFNETNKKIDVEFVRGHVAFKKTFIDMNFTDNDTICLKNCSKINSEILLFDASFFKKFYNYTDAYKYLLQLSSNLNESFQFWNIDIDPQRLKSWLFSTFSGVCSDKNGNQTRFNETNIKICQLFQTTFEGLSASQKLITANFAVSIMEEMLNSSGIKFTIIKTQGCSKMCEKFTSYLHLIVQYHLCVTNDIFPILNQCGKENGTVIQLGDTILDQKLILDVLERLLFTTLRIFVSFRPESENYLFSRLSLNSLALSDKELIKNVIYNEKLPIKLDLCVDKWNMDSSTIFQLSEFNGYSFPKKFYSEYALPPVQKINPCLQPQPNKLYNVIFDGLWNPIQFLYKNSAKIYSETVHRYEAIYAGLTEDDMKFRMNSIYGMDLFITIPCSKYQMKSKTDICANKPFQNESKFEFSVEPISGSFWNFDISYQLNAKLPEELFILFNISTELRNKFLPLMVVRRTAEVTRSGVDFYKNTIKPFLMVICGGTVVFQSLAIGLLILAAYLVIRLHWTPNKGRRFIAQLPDLDLQQLNTVKLRKLLGQ